MQPPGVVSFGDVAGGEQTFLFLDGGQHGAISNGGQGENIQSTGNLTEFHQGAVEAVYEHGGLRGGIHRHSTNLPHRREGQDVRDRIQVESNLVEVWEVANERRLLETALGDGANSGTWPDVLEHVAIPEYGDGGLGIEEHPRRIDCIALSAVQKQSGANWRVRRGVIWAVACIMASGVASETRDALMKNAVAAGELRGSLSECEC